MAEAVACESCKKETVIPTSICINMFGGQEKRVLVCPTCGDYLLDIFINFIKLPKTT